MAKKDDVQIQNGYLIRLDLTPEEGKALDELATRECRLTHEQGRYLIRKALIELGLLANDSAAQQSVHPTAAGGSDSDENLESGGG